MGEFYEVIKTGLEEAIAYERGEGDGNTDTVEITVPDEEIREALREADEMRKNPNRKSYGSARELFEALKKETMEE